MPPRPAKGVKGCIDLHRLCVHPFGPADSREVIEHEPPSGDPVGAPPRPGGRGAGGGRPEWMRGRREQCRQHLGARRPRRPGRQPSPTLLSIPEWNTQAEGAHVPLESGTYSVQLPWSVAGFTVSFPEGWTVQYGHAFGQHSDQPDEFGFYGVVVDEIFTDACRGEGGTTRAIGPGVRRSLITALREQHGGALKTNVTDTILGGYPTTRIDLRIPKRADLDRCRMAEYWDSRSLQVWYSEPADKYFVLLPGAVAPGLRRRRRRQAPGVPDPGGQPRSAADMPSFRRCSTRSTSTGRRPIGAQPVTTVRPAVIAAGPLRS